MKKLFLYAKIALVIAGVGFFAVCLSWLGEAVRIADLPGYKEVGILSLIVAVIAYIAISFYLLFGRRK